MSSRPNSPSEGSANDDPTVPPAPSAAASTRDGGAPARSPIEQMQVDAVRAQIVEVLRTVHDPEIPVNIYELGLVYDVDVQPAGPVTIRMTLTSPACPVAGTLPIEVEEKVKAVDGVKTCRVDVVWDPPWTPAMMSEAAKLELGME